MGRLGSEAFGVVAFFLDGGEASHVQIERAHDADALGNVDYDW